MHSMEAVVGDRETLQSAIRRETDVHLSQQHRDLVDVYLVIQTQSKPSIPHRAMMNQSTILN